MYDIKYNGLVSVSDIDCIYKNKFNSNVNINPIKLINIPIACAINDDKYMVSFFLISLINIIVNSAIDIV